MNSQELRDKITTIARKIEQTGICDKLVEAMKTCSEDNVTRVFRDFRARHFDISQEIIMTCNKSALSFDTKEGKAFQYSTDISFNVLALLILLAIAGRNDIDKLFDDFWTFMCVLEMQGYTSLEHYFFCGNRPTPNSDYFAEICF